ncbi:MAG: RNA polymerase sigma factor [Agathobaculum sp.]|uniref:RNA polymerase sigma factor n=1 Tax=Agathobaculum sp. TaxID=2048138 RepID=UPI003D90654D
MDAHKLDELFCSGSEQALADVIALYGQPLLRYCHHILCDYHDAQDAVQTTFIKAYDNRSRFQAGSNLGAWLYRLAYHTCVDLLRQRKLHMIPPPAEGTETDYIGEELRQALEQLAPEQRALVYGRVIEERSFDALAVIYGKPAATLRKRYERARKKLALLLQDTSEGRRRSYESNAR